MTPSSKSPVRNYYPIELLQDTPTLLPKYSQAIPRSFPSHSHNPKGFPSYYNDISRFFGSYSKIIPKLFPSYFQVIPKLFPVCPHVSQLRKSCMPGVGVGGWVVFVKYKDWSEPINLHMQILYFPLTNIPESSRNCRKLFFS